MSKNRHSWIPVFIIIMTALYIIGMILATIGCSKVDHEICIYGILILAITLFTPIFAGLINIIRMWCYLWKNTTGRRKK